MQTETSEKCPCGAVLLTATATNTKWCQRCGGTGKRGRYAEKRDALRAAADRGSDQESVATRLRQDRERCTALREATLAEQRHGMSTIVGKTVAASGVTDDGDFSIEFTDGSSVLFRGNGEYNCGIDLIVTPKL